jgi:hypothetical protein
LILFDLINFLIGWKNGRLRCANGLAQPLGLVAHLSGDRVGRSANGGAGGSPAGSVLPAAGLLEKWF